MTQKRRRICRKWIGMILSLCIFLSMMPTAVFADAPDNETFTYTGGMEDHTHTGENALGDLVLNDPVQLEDDVTEYAALIVSFPDEGGGGDVKMETGDLTSEADPVTKKVKYGEPGYPYEYDYGEQDAVFETYGLIIHMDDSSSLEMKTGDITNTSGDASLITVTDHSELDLKTGDIDSKKGSVFIPDPPDDSETDDESTDDSEPNDESTDNTEKGHYEYTSGDGIVADIGNGANATIETGTISAEGSGVKIEGNNSKPKESDPAQISIQTKEINSGDSGIETRVCNAETTITVEGDIQSDGSGLSLNHNYGGGVNAIVTGSIDAECCGVSLSAENGIAAVISTGDITSGGSGISASSKYGSTGSISSGTVSAGGTGVGVTAYSGGVAEVDVAGDVNAGGTGIGLQASLDSNISVDVTGSVISEGGKGVEITNGAFENNGKFNTVDVSIGGSVTSDDDAFHVNNNYGTVNIHVGVNKKIEDAGTITSSGSYSAFIEANPESTINFTAGDINGSNYMSSIRPEANGNYSAVTVNVGNVTNDSGKGIQGTASGIDSLVDIDAGDINANEIGLAVHVENSVVVGNTEDGSYSVHSGTVNADVGTITSGYNGIYASMEYGSDGSITVNSGAVDADYNGVQAKTTGFDSESGITIHVNGDVSAGVAGISADSYGGSQELAYESGVKIEVLEDDPHENWWEKTRYDEDWRFIWVSTGEGDDIQWTKYRSSSNDNEYEGYSAEDLNLPVFWEHYDGDGEFVPFGFDTDPDNFVNISTGGVQAGQYGVKTNNNGGKFDITVDGDVAVNWEDPESWEVSGIYAENYSGTTNISIDGNMSVASTFTGDGITLKNYDGKVNIDVAGNVEAADGTAVIIQSDKGDTSLNIGGDVNAKNGIDVDVNETGTGTVQINIAGSLYTAGNGIKIGREQDNQGPAHVIGDVAPEPNNHVIGDVAPEPASGATPAVDLVVEETISGLTPILVSNIEAITNVLITTWAVIPNENSQISADQNGNAVRKVEKNINYIIKKEDNKFGTLSVAGTTAKEVPNQSAGEPVAAETEGGRRRGAPAEEQEPANTKTLNVAKEKEKLTLTVSLNEEYRTGYDIVIYNGVGENKKEAEVENLENGDFCFKVPWAGGVYLTFGLMKDGQIVPETEPEPEPDDNPDPDPDPDPNSDDNRDPDPDSNPEKNPEPELKPEPKAEPDSVLKQEETGTKTDSKAGEKTKPETDSKPDSATIVADNDVSDAGNGRVVAILYGEKEDGIEEDYIIWFMSGYGYKAKFKDGYTEYGTYRVKDNELILTARDGSERKITDRVIAFDEERKAQIVKTDFSDSAKIIGEFNVNDENILEITDRDLKALNPAAIHETIDNPYAWEILKAILTEKAE